MKSPVRLFIGVLFLILFFTATTKPIFAQQINTAENNQNAQALQLNLDKNVPTNFHTLTQSLIFELMSGTSCLLVGQDTLNPKQQCLGPDPLTGKIGYLKNNEGAVGAMGSMIADLYTPTITSRDYFSYLSRSFGVGQAYAASNSYNNCPINYGYGYCGLLPFINVWVQFRNIAYAVLTIVFVVIGFAIMLRLKIDPRTVMTIQNQIPRLIIAILMVTFSYAIAGLLIDLMWTSTFVVINVFHQVQPAINPTTAYSHVTDQPFGFVNATVVPAGGNILDLSFQGAGDAKDVIQSMFMSTGLTAQKNPINGPPLILGGALGGAAGGLGAAALCTAVTVGTCIVATPLFITGGALAGLFAGGTIGGGFNPGQVMGNIFGWLIGWIASFLVFLVLIVAVLVALFRLWFTLIKAYVFILLDIMIAPLWFITGALPGGQGFTAWFRDMAGNLIAFPTAVAMLLMGKLFMVTTSVGQSFVPPLVGNPLGPSFMPLIGIGFILATPGVVQMTRNALKSPDIKIPGLGPSIMAGGAFPGKLIQGGMQAGFGTNVDHSGARKRLLRAFTGVH